jgi:hypothetical protein
VIINPGRMIKMLKLHEKLKGILNNSKCNDIPINLELSYDELAHLYSIEKGFQSYLDTIDKELLLALDKTE